MDLNERITNQVFEMIAESFDVPLGSVTRDYVIGPRVEKVVDRDLDNLDKTHGLLNLVEFTMRLEEVLPQDIYRMPTQLRQDRLFHKRLAFGRVTAGQLIDWTAEYQRGARGGDS